MKFTGPRCFVAAQPFQSVMPAARCSGISGSGGWHLIQTECDQRGGNESG
jgi:hypothetical protein